MKNDFSFKTDPSTTNGHLFWMYRKWKSNCIQGHGCFQSLHILIAWKKSLTFHWLNSRRHGAICVDDDHHWNELHCCNRHVDPHRDNLLRTGTELPSSWASFNQISSPANGGWSLRAVWNSGRPPYLWASGVQIVIIHKKW